MFYQKGLGINHNETVFEKQHPAPFSFQDVNRFISFFTKENELVLDPFSGVASTLKACAISNRHGLGIELSKKWANLGKERLEKETPNSKNQKVLIGDSRIILKKLAKESVSYVITSPPYWNILAKKTGINKRKERLNSGLETKYSNSNTDLGNIQSYPKFLDSLGDCFKECYRILENRRYITIIVSDFRHKSELVPFHNHIIEMCTKIGLTLQGITILVQRNKKLYPYGYPYAYVPNIHHQYAITLRKL